MTVESKKGPARVRTGVSGIFSMKIHLKNQSDNHYTTEPILTGKRIVQYFHLPSIPVRF